MFYRFRNAAPWVMILTLGAMLFVSGAVAEVETREANNGNVILEAVPRGATEPRGSAQPLSECAQRIVPGLERGW